MSFIRLRATTSESLGHAGGDGESQYEFQPGSPVPESADRFRSVRRLRGWFLKASYFAFNMFKSSKAPWTQFRKLMLPALFLVPLGCIAWRRYRATYAERYWWNLVPECEPGEVPDIQVFPHYLPPREASYLPSDGDYSFKGKATTLKHRMREWSAGKQRWSNLMFMIRGREWEEKVLSTNPLECDALYVHSMNDVILARLWRFRELNIPYFESHSGACYMSTFYTCRPQHPDMPPPTPPSQNEWAQVRRAAQVESRYVSNLRLMEMVEKGSIVRPPAHDGTPETPWLVYLDADIVFSNSTASVNSVIDNIASSLARNLTAETIVFSDSAQTRALAKLPLLSEAQIATVLSLEDAFVDKWVVNNGVQVYTPSRMAKFIQEAILSILPYTHKDLKKRHLSFTFGSGDQGKTEFLLQEVFDVIPDRIRYFRQEEKGLAKACQEGLPVMIKTLNWDKVRRHELFLPVAQRVFGDDLIQAEQEVTSSERSLLVIVCPRVMNAPACPRAANFKSGLMQQRLNFHCGDFLAHFNGCGKENLFSKRFRHEVARKKECRKVWPGRSAALEDGSPFSWGGFLAEANRMNRQSDWTSYRNPFSLLRDMSQLARRTG